MYFVPQLTTDPGSSVRNCDIWNKILHACGVREEMQKG